MRLIDLLLLVDTELTGSHVDKEDKTADDGQDLEEIVLGEVAVRMVRLQGPEVIDDDVEDAQDDHQDDSAPLSFEPDNNHHASHESQNANQSPADAPLSTENEPNEQEDEQNSSGKLEVHFSILLFNLRDAGKGESFTVPAVGDNHEESTHDGEIAKEEVEIEDETVSESLGDHDTDETTDGVS